MSNNDETPIWPWEQIPWEQIPQDVANFLQALLQAIWDAIQAITGSPM